MKKRVIADGVPRRSVLGPYSRTCDCVSTACIVGSKGHLFANDMSVVVFWKSAKARSYLLVKQFMVQITAGSGRLTYSAINIDD